MSDAALAERLRGMFDADTARITRPLGRMFLVIGSKRNTKNDLGQWARDGEPFDFEYTEEKVIASGYTEEELIASAEKYKRLLNITMEEYLAEAAQADKPTGAGE